MFTLTIATKLISFLLNIRLAQFFYIDLLIFSAFDLQLFSVLFFFMLFVLGIGSNIAMCTCVITILRDRFKALKAWQAAIGLSTFGFLFGLVYVTPVSNFIHLKQINKRLELFRNGTHVSSQHWTTGDPNYQLSLDLLFHAQQGGQYILNLVDFYGASFIVFMLAIVELVAVSWIYGIDINSGFIAPLIVN